MQYFLFALGQDFILLLTDWDLGGLVEQLEKKRGADYDHQKRF